MKAHIHPVALLVLLAVALSCRSSWAQHEAAITPELYEAVCDVAVDSLPRPLQAFYRHHLDTLHATAVSIDPATKPDGVPKPALIQRNTGSDHYVWLDAEAPPDADANTRLAAAATFRKVYTNDGGRSAPTRGRRGGTLPAALERTFEGLADAFRKKDDTALIANTGLLIHLSVDAATPTQVTAWGSGERHRQAQARLAEEAAEHTIRLIDEVRVSPTRFHVVANPLDEVLDALVATHRAAVMDFAPLLARSDSGDDELWAKLLEDRLEAGALLSARLIGTAWTRADLPQLPTPPQQLNQPVVDTDTPATETGAPADTASAGPFVGTRTSNVFHKRGCRHAQRIAPKNLVTFSSSQEAVRAGRKPCRTCKP